MFLSRAHPARLHLQIHCRMTLDSKEGSFMEEMSLLLAMTDHYA